MKINPDEFLRQINQPKPPLREHTGGDTQPSGLNTLNSGGFQKISHGSLANMRLQGYNGEGGKTRDPEMERITKMVRGLGNSGARMLSCLYKAVPDPEGFVAEYVGFYSAGRTGTSPDGAKTRQLSPAQQFSAYLAGQSDKSNDAGPNMQALLQSVESAAANSRSSLPAGVLEYLKKESGDPRQLGSFLDNAFGKKEPNPSSAEVSERLEKEGGAPRQLGNFYKTLNEKAAYQRTIDDDISDFLTGRIPQNQAVISAEENTLLKDLAQQYAMHPIRTEEEKSSRFRPVRLPEKEQEENESSEPPVSVPVKPIEVFNSYDYSLEDMVTIQVKTGGIGYHGGSASREEILEYLDPKNYMDGVYKYQFLDLSAPAGISRTEMSRFLDGKGILDGKEDSFLNAAKQYNISEVYLAAHSAHETGNGTSSLSKGYGIDGKKYYNMYGIGAYRRDGEPNNMVNERGARYARDNGWTTPEIAIEEGAKWISEHYVNSPVRQNTLYKMRWNPGNPGQNQYATDVGWAVKQTYNIKKMYDSFTNPSITFEIPDYLS